MSNQTLSPALASTMPSFPAPEPKFVSFRIGEIEGLALSDGGIPVPGPPGTSRLVLRQLSCLLVRSPETAGWILLDSGFGPVPKMMGEPLPTGGCLLASLALAGIAPADIGTVLVSHIHPDHVDGLYDESGARVFPNAEYRVGAEELAFWSQDNLDLSWSPAPPPRKAEMLAAATRLLGFAKGSLKTFRAGDAAAPGVGTILLPGHTPGQVGFILTSGDRQLLYTADALTTPEMSINIPERHHLLDLDPEQGVITRLALLGTLSEPGWQTFTPHFPWPGLGSVQGAGKTFTWMPTA